MGFDSYLKFSLQSFSAYIKFKNCLFQLQSKPIINDLLEVKNWDIFWNFLRTLQLLAKKELDKFISFRNYVIISRIFRQKFKLYLRDRFLAYTNFERKIAKSWKVLTIWKSHDIRNSVGRERLTLQYPLPKPYTILYVLRFSSFKIASKIWCLTLGSDRSRWSCLRVAVQKRVPQHCPYEPQRIGHSHSLRLATHCLPREHLLLLRDWGRVGSIDLWRGILNL